MKELKQLRISFIPVCIQIVCIKIDSESSCSASFKHPTINLAKYYAKSFAKVERKLHRRRVWLCVLQEVRCLLHDNTLSQIHPQSACVMIIHYCPIFLGSLYWLISLFINSIINIPYTHTHTSLRRWIFCVRVRLEGDREGKSLFSIFSLITNQYISLRRPDHSVGRRMGSFSPLFISLLFNTFLSVLLLGISQVSKCQTNKPRDKIPFLPLSFWTRLHVQYAGNSEKLALLEHFWGSCLP